jgi:hemin uptake protein HemP
MDSRPPVPAPAHPPATQPLPAPGAEGAIPRISSEQLLAGSQEVLIEHRGALYRLRQTSLGKLILTK